MKALVCLLLLGGSALAQTTKKPCVIVHQHEKKVGEALMRWTQPKPFDYVEGDFPQGMKFHYEIGDKTIRQIQDKSGKVVTMKAGYGLPDLEDARNTCKAFQEEK